MAVRVDSTTKKVLVDASSKLVLCCAPPGISCRSKTGSMWLCGYGAPHIGSDFSTCYKHWDCSFDCDPCGLVDSVDCCGRLFLTNTKVCCPGEGTGSATKTVGWKTPEYRTDNPGLTQDVYIECDYFLPFPVNPPDPTEGLESCSFADFTLSDEMDYAAMRAQLEGYMGAVAWPTWSSPVEIVPEENGISEGYCPVSVSYGPACSFSGNNMQLETTQYKLIFDASPVGFTANWEVWDYPSLGSPTVTSISEFIPAYATESSVHDLFPPTEINGTAVIFNYSVS